MSRMFLAGFAVLSIATSLNAIAAEVQVRAAKSSAIVLRPYRGTLTWSGGTNSQAMAEGAGRLVIYDRKGDEVVATFNGVMSAGKLTGNVRAEYPKSRDRAIYIGEFSNWSENGIGTMTFRDGTQLTGLWRDGEFVGKPKSGSDAITPPTPFPKTGDEDVPVLPTPAQGPNGGADYVPPVQKAAQAGDPNALGKMSLLIQLGTVVGTPSKAFDLAKASAEKGSPFGRCALGSCYEDGVGVTSNKQKAEELYKSCRAELERLATSGDPLTQIFCGGCYVSRDGDDQDARNRAGWFRKAADQGNAIGQALLGSCYLDGKGVAKDPKEAVKWMRKAADQGTAIGQVLLGSCYLGGVGVAKDPKEAVWWMRKAAEQNLAEAQYVLGVCYEVGTGVEKDQQQAVEWFRKAADQGHAESKTYLGKQIAQAKHIQDIFDSAEDANAEKYGGPSTAEIMQPWLDLEALSPNLRGFSKAIGYKIKRGKPFKSSGIRKIPDGTTLFPIRVTTIEKIGTVYYYKDPFDEWNFVEIKD